MDDGANGSNAAISSLPEEVDHNFITCSDNASACQGVEMHDAPYSYVHNNYIVLPSSCPDCQDSARGILFDTHSSHGQAAYNDIVTWSNRAVRVRGSQYISVHDNLFENITKLGRFGAIHIGENYDNIDDDPMTVFNNTFQLGPGGNGVVSAVAVGAVVYGNTVTCVSEDCAGVGFFAMTDVPSTNYVQTGTTITVKNNDVTPLSTNGLPAVKACGPGDGAAHPCASPTGSGIVFYCNTGTVVGGGTITQQCP